MIPSFKPTPIADLDVLDPEIESVAGTEVVAVKDGKTFRLRTSWLAKAVIAAVDGVAAIGSQVSVATEAKNLILNKIGIATSSAEAAATDRATVAADKAIVVTKHGEVVANAAIAVEARDEAVAAAASFEFETEAGAEAGVNTDKNMNALLTKQSIEINAELGEFLAAPGAIQRRMGRALVEKADAGEWGFDRLASASTNKDALLFARDDVTSNGTIVLPGGSFNVGAAVSFNTKGLRIVSDRATKLLFPAGHGIQVQLNAGDENFEMRGVRLLTSSTEAAGGTALSVEYTPSGFANREGRRLVMDDVHIGGENNASAGWARLGHLTNINGATMSRIVLNGRGTSGTTSSDEASQTITPMGIEVDGLNYPTDYLISQFHAYQMNTALKFSGAVEGVSVNQFVAVGVKTFLDWTPSVGYGGRPLLGLTGCPHANVYQNLVKAEAIQQIRIRDVVVYHSPDSISSAKLLELFNCIDVVLSGNFLGRYATGSPTTTGISIGGSASSNIIIESNQFGGEYTTLTKGIDIAASTPGVWVKNGNQFNCTTDIADASPQYTEYGAKRVHGQSGAGQVVPSATYTDFVCNQVVFDPDGWLNTTTGVFTVPVGVKAIRFTTSFLMDGSSAGLRLYTLMRNTGSGFAAVPGAYEIKPPDSGGRCWAVFTSPRIEVSAGHQFIPQLYQDSGGDLTAQGYGVSGVRIEVLG